MAVAALSTGSDQSLIELMKERRAALKAMQEAVRSGDIASAQKSLATLKSTSPDATSGTTAASPTTGDATNPFRTTMKADLSNLTAAVEKGDLAGAQSALQTLDTDKAQFLPPAFAQFDQSGDQGFVTFNPVDFQMLTAQQDSHISRLFTGDG